MTVPHAGEDCFWALAGPRGLAGCRFSPWSACMGGDQSVFLFHIDVCVSLSLLLSLRPIITSSREALKNLKEDCSRKEPREPLPPWPARQTLPSLLQVTWWKTRSLLDGRPLPKEASVLRFAGQRGSGMLPSLEAFSEFRLTVLAYNSKGAGPESEPYTFQTPEGGERGPCGAGTAWEVPAAEWDRPSV